jgi:hypothetical protein
MRKEPEKPKTKMELMRENDMSGYVRMIQSKRIADMEEKYIEDRFLEEPKLPYIPETFVRKGNFPEGNKISQTLGELGWNYHNGQFLHPYTTAEINTVHELQCNGGRILVPGYDSYMDEKGVSSNIMNVDNIPQYFSENTYVKHMYPGGCMKYKIEQHKFIDFWNDTRRGRRTANKYRYIDGRKRRKEEFANMRATEIKRRQEYEEAKKTLRSNSLNY